MPAVSTQGRKTVACICPNNKSAGKGIPFDNAHFTLFLFDVNDKEARYDLTTVRVFPMRPIAQIQSMKRIKI
jgi:hypothetical protein